MKLPYPPPSLILAAIACIGLVPATVTADTLYTQPFTNTSGSEQAVAHVPDWDSFYAGNGSQNTVRVRLQTTNSGVIWVDNNNTIGFVIRGTDISVPLAQVGEISFDTLQSKATAGPLSVLIQIDGGDWFVSNAPTTPQVAASWSAAETAELDYNASLSFSTAQSAWNRFEMTSTGVISTSLAATLSGTTITGIGWFVKSSETGNYVRFDNLLVSSSTIPEPGSAAWIMGGVVLIGSALRRRRS